MVVISRKKVFHGNKKVEYHYYLVPPVEKKVLLDKQTVSMCDKKVSPPV